MQTALQKGSKSFSFASLFLGSQERRDAEDLYAWCRACDDFIDEPSELNPLNQSTQTHRIETLFARKGISDWSNFESLLQRRNISFYYAHELLSGLRTDAELDTYFALTNRPKLISYQDLRRYCYRVASTVGLMMCSILMLKNKKALHYAAHLGMAMQLTNIARDLHEDAKRGRVYLPLELGIQNYDSKEFLSTLIKGSTYEHGLEKSIHPSLNKEGLGISEVRRRLLLLAELFYRSGEKGIQFLPYRAGLAIRVAAGVYEAIGDSISKDSDWIERHYTSRLAKWSIATKSLFSHLLMPFSSGEFIRSNYLFGDSYEGLAVLEYESMDSPEGEDEWKRKFLRPQI